MEVVQIKNTRFEDLLDGVYKLEKHLKEIDAKISSTKIEYIPMSKVLKTLDISRKTADNWHKQGTLIKKYSGGKVFYSTEDIKKMMEEQIMKNLKKSKKIIKVNYCFENGDELEIPFIYKPAVMTYLQLPFDKFQLNPVKEKAN